MSKRTLAEWREVTDRHAQRRSYIDVEPVYKHIGSIILEMRQRHGFTQAQLSIKLGWSRAAIANIEAGRQRVLLHQLPVIADFLQIPAIELLPEGYLA